MKISPLTYREVSGWLRKHVAVVSTLVFLCSCSVRLFLAERADPRDVVALYSDAVGYLAPAASLVERGAFLNSTKEPMVDRTPGYPTFIAALMLLVGRDLHKILLAQAFVLSLTPVVLYGLARRILPPTMAFIGAILCAVSPWGAVLAGIVMSDGLFLLVLGVIMFAMKVGEQAETFRFALFSGISVGLLTGLAVLIRPLWPLVFIVPAASLCCGAKRKRVWLQIFVSLICAVAPVAMWRVRNETEAGFRGISDISGKAAFLYLAPRVDAAAHGTNRYEAVSAAYRENSKLQWALSAQQADDEHWRRATAIFREHPYLTAYSFVRSATEHAIHPSPIVLAPARLRFRGDFFVLGIIWAALLLLAALGCLCSSDPSWDDGEINRRWLLTLLAICLFLTLLSGISFAAGSRLRAPLELMVPLLAAIGLVRGIRAITFAVRLRMA